MATPPMRSATLRLPKPAVTPQNKRQRRTDDHPDDPRTPLVVAPPIFDLPTCTTTEKAFDPRAPRDQGVSAVQAAFAGAGSCGGCSWACLTFPGVFCALLDI